MTSISNSATNDTEIPILPEGYVSVIGPDQHKYVVPQFMVPALHQCLDGYRLKRELDVSGQSGSVSDIYVLN